MKPRVKGKLVQNLSAFDLVQPPGDFLLRSHSAIREEGFSLPRLPNQGNGMTGEGSIITDFGVAQHLREHPTSGQELILFLCLPMGSFFCPLSSFALTLPLRKIFESHVIETGYQNLIVEGFSKGVKNHLQKSKHFHGTDCSGPCVSRCDLGPEPTRSAPPVSLLEMQTRPYSRLPHQNLHPTKFSRPILRADASLRR